MPKWVGGMGAGSGKFVKSVFLEMHSLQLFSHKDNIIKETWCKKYMLALCATTMYYLTQESVHTFHVQSYS